MTGFYVSTGLLTSEHMKRIGPALPEFLWLVAHETKEAGKVLNGSPVTVERIADELGESTRTAKRNLTRLWRQGYAARDRKYTNQIYSYTVAHSKKWVHPRGDKNVTSDGICEDTNVPAAMTKMSPHGAENVTVPFPPYESIAIKRSRYLDEVFSNVQRQLEEMDRYRESNGQGQAPRSATGGFAMVGDEIKRFLR